MPNRDFVSREEFRELVKILSETIITEVIERQEKSIDNLAAATLQNIAGLEELILSYCEDRNQPILEKVVYAEDKRAAKLQEARDAGWKIEKAGGE